MIKQPIIQFQLEKKYKSLILEFVKYSMLVNKKLFFLKKAPSLDVDKKGKDSSELFSSGLDYCMLVTGKYRYLQAKENFVDKIEISNEIDWIIQENDLVLADVQIKIENEKFTVDYKNKNHRINLSITELFLFLEKIL